MIRDRNVADDAQIQLHKIVGAMSPNGQFLTGEIFWVGNDGDAAFEAMATKIKADHLFTSGDTAVGSCVANRGDTIVFMEGHNESVIAAGGLDLDVAGITMVFLGTGTSQAKITFGTAVTASMTVDAADITLIRPKFVAGLDSLTGPIDINATDFTMIDVEYHDATNIETTDAVITDANATRLKINGYKYFSVTETGDQKQSHIQLNGCDDIELKNIDIRGDFFVGNIENVTDEVLNMRGENWYLENLNVTPTPALYLDANATGSMKNVKLKIASGVTYVNSVAKVSWDDRCEGFMGDGYAGEPIGTVLASGVEGKVDKIYSDTGNIRTDATEILSDIETVKSDLVLVDAVVDKIYSDTGNIRTDATEILSDLETVMSDLIAADLVIDKIYSDSGNIRTDVTDILSDLETVKSDLVLADAVVDKIYSDTGNIRTDVTEILSDLETTNSDLVALDAVADKIYSDTGNIRTDVAKIYSDTGNIRTDATEILSDLETIASDLVIADAIIDDIYSDTTAMLARLATGKMVSDANASSASDSTVIDISDIGVLTGITQMLVALEAVDGTLTVRVDGVQLITSGHFTTYPHASISDVVVNTMPFNLPFETSLHINHQKSVATGTLYTFVSYTTD